MAELLPMTRTGYEKLKAERDRLQNEEMPKAAQKVADARAEGDLSENAEYHGARETQGMLQAKINLLNSKLAQAQIVDTSKLPRDQVVFGATVVVSDLDLGGEEEFTLVGAGEENPDAGRILVTTPLAQGLINRKIGDKVAIQVPQGVLNFKIVDIRFDDM